MSNDRQHVVVTPPDRYWSDAFRIMMVDFDWGIVESIIQPLRGSPVDLAIYLYNSSDNDAYWLFDNSAHCDLVLIDVNKPTNNDLLKGVLISKPNCWYVGRKDLEKFWPRHTDDPLGRIMSELDRRININEEIDEKRI